VSLITVKNLSAYYESRKVFENLNFTVEQGDYLCIVGENGSGKTTLIKLLRGDIRPYYDEESPSTMRIFGEDRWNLFEIRGRMGVVSMDLQSMFRSDTIVSEVICSGFFNSLDVFRNHTVTPDMIRSVLNAAKEMGIEDILEHEIGNISLGEMRRALIARALVTDPSLLVLDEPMTGLDIVMKSKFRSMFDLMISSGISIVMVTHDLTDIPVSVKRIVMIRDGEVFADGLKEELLTDEVVSELYGEPIKVECLGGIYSMHLSGDVTQ